ncbi:hypothetical protein FAM21834_02691 [Lentilactobacillus parabuchneri]|uniref:hypothetical protein n=1 Tax=Lentilactobacillus TaxID=2767893 RepID=UPI000A10C9C1|nr:MULTISPECIES: hypothetical protein [Lentilactobacillus]ORN05380.1 hypothetical protein FAM21834_02691 [Lentilactobacillus parabuchneri]TJY12149.1 hypothetical protein FCF15_04195 [Lentilactobacillus buchneri]
MAYAELKPIKFSGFLRKKRFFSETGIKDVLIKTGNVIAINNTSENFKIWSRPKIQKAMLKNSATFLIISNRQLAFITFGMLKHGFNLKNVKIYSDFQKKLIDSAEFIPDNYRSFNLSDIISLFDTGIETNIAEVYLRKQKQEIIIKANGVIGFTNFSDQNKGEFLRYICEAYNESQT